jgi:hypothetical protein
MRKERLKRLEQEAEARRPPEKRPELKVYTCETARDGRETWPDGRPDPGADPSSFLVIEVVETRRPGTI